MSAGKGMAPRKGYNQAKYAANYDAIFRKTQPTQPAPLPMKPKESNPPKKGTQ